MSKTTRATQALAKAGVAFTVHTYDYDPTADRVGIQAAEALGNPALAREPAFLEMVYLAAKARERAGQEIPAGSAPGVTLETGPGGSPASSESGDDVADRIVAAGGRKPFRIGG